jgi:CheY-like chemotaxis protein
VINTILLVDDEEIDHVITKYTLAEYNPDIVVTSVYDGDEALAFLQNSSQPPDLILLDINMPGMNGHQFLAAYAEWDKRSSVVVMLTSSDQDSDRRQCEQYQFVYDVLLKPLSVSDLERLDKSE